MASYLSRSKPGSREFLAPTTRRWGGHLASYASSPGSTEPGPRGRCQKAPANPYQIGGAIPRIVDRCVVHTPREYRAIAGAGLYTPSGDRCPPANPLCNELLSLYSRPSHSAATHPISDLRTRTTAHREIPTILDYTCPTYFVGIDMFGLTMRRKLLRDCA